MPDIFLSYNRDDQAIARRFAEGLQRAGLSVWWDVTLKSGEDYDKATEQALRGAKAVVVLWSKRSVESRWVRTEATIALQNNKLVPVMIEACQRPIMFELSQTADLSHWKGDSNDAVWQQLVADVQGVVTGTAGAASAAGVRAGKPVMPASSRAAQLLVGAVGLLIVVMLALNLLRPAASGPAAPAAVTPATTDSPAATTSVEPAAPANPRTAVAVMAFANLTGDATKDYLGEGMSEELILTLGKVPGLTVPSRTSTFAYRGRNTDLRQIASDLGVGTVLEGSVRAAGSTIRISATLIDAQTDRQLWSENYDRDFSDLFKVQDELARAIVQALQNNLSNEAQAVLANARPTDNIEAYNLFLQASQIGQRGPANVAPALDLLDQAIALDPTFARAFGIKAGLMMLLVQNGFAEPALALEAEAAAIAGNAIDPADPGSLAGLGGIAAIRGNWSQAEQLFQRAAGQSSSINTFEIPYAVTLLDSVGHLQRATELLESAYRKAPAVPAIPMIIATNHSIFAQDAEALRYSRIAEDLGMSPDSVPMPQIRANAAMRRGDYATAADELTQGLLPVVRDAGGEALIRQVYAAINQPGLRPAAVASLQEFTARLSTDIDPNFRKDIIVMLTMLGALDEAFVFANGVLDVYAETSMVGFAWGVLWLAEMKPFRQDPRFQDIARRLKLFDYWNEYGPPDGCVLEADRVVCQ